MGYPTDRIQLFDHDMNPLHEIVPSELFARVLREEINGEHSLTIETSRRLEIGWRALTVDGMGKWREWVVEETDELHDSGMCATGTYRMVWSLQYDMSHTFDDTGNLGHAEVGLNSAGDAATALGLAIRGSKRWTVGPCDATPVTAGKGVVMIAESAWERISKVVTAWGGELDAIIEVGLFGVTSRKVVLMRHLGNTEPTRRFEWGDDLTSISRTPDPGPYFCRVVPIGRGSTEYADGPSDDPLDDEVSFEWPLSLRDDPEYFPYDDEWIQDDDAAAAFRVSDGRGGWEYPTKVVKYDKDDVELMYYEALADLHNHTRPNVTYTADVAQFARAGMDVKGVALGDEVQCVDRGFNPDVGLAIQERVTAMEVDELNDYATTLTIGDSIQSITTMISDVTAKANEAESVLTYYSTKKYLNDLLDRLNEELNVTGGYAYLVPGHGIFTYDVAVTDPLVGTEATQVVQIVGGGIRIANSRKANGEWDWRSVFTSGHIAADLVTAAKIMTGYIGSATDGNYWNLDTGEFRLASTTYFGDGDQTLADYIANATPEINVDEAIYNYLTNNGKVKGIFNLADNRLYINATYINTGKLNADLITSGKIQSKNGRVYFDLTNNELACDRMVSTDYGNNIIAKIGTISIEHGNVSNYKGFAIHESDYDEGAIVFAPATSSSESPQITSPLGRLRLRIRTTQGGSMGYGYSGLVMTSDGYTVLHGGTRNMSDSNAVSSESDNDSGRVVCCPAYYGTSGSYTQGGEIKLYGNLEAGRADIYELICSGPKNRVVGTKSYGNRLMYCYETPSPMFGDIGSGTIGSDGVCVVMIDDIFDECARTDIAYQVFLQKCGRGDLWVAEKTPTYFVVEGTANLAFDWEIKAKQVDFEFMRLENLDIRDKMTDSTHTVTGFIESAYSDDTDLYVDEIERLYKDEMI